MSRGLWSQKLLPNPHIRQSDGVVEEAYFIIFCITRLPQPLLIIDDNSIIVVCCHNCGISIDNATSN
jgi:hypothetical protein